jgi:hypothetical protein
MNIGGLYRLTDKQQKVYEKQQERFKSTTLGIPVYVGKKLRIMSLDTLIVPLEMYRTSEDGGSLRGENSRRVKILLSTGEIATMFLSTEDWELVTQ